jgi:DNA-directed RNA polymerase subunit RPC12/RpoP
MRRCLNCGANLDKEKSIGSRIRGVAFYHVDESGELVEDAVAIKKRGSIKCRNCGLRLNKILVRAKIEGKKDD